MIFPCYPQNFKRFCRPIWILEGFSGEPGFLKVLINLFHAATTNHCNIYTSDRPYEVVLPKKFSALALVKK